jgi:hypothetical protein
MPAMLPSYPEGNGDGEDNVPVVDAFLQKCIFVGGQLWNKVVKPYLDLKKLGHHANIYLGAIVPALLRTVMCRATDGSLVKASGHALHESFCSFFLSHSRSHASIWSNIDVMLLYTSLANVPLTGTSGADRGARIFYVRAALQCCLSISPTSTTPEGASDLIAPWVELTSGLQSESDGFRKGGPAHTHFGDVLRAIPVHKCGSHKRNDAKRKADKQLVATGRQKQTITKNQLKVLCAAKKSRQASGHDGAPASETVADEGGVASKALDPNAAEAAVPEAAVAQVAAAPSLSQGADELRGGRANAPRCSARRSVTFSSC